ncbi:hypothetical protein HNQ03_003239 [Chryseobacterium sp. 16F]|uniref:Uncharacterized protein n=1 Tax=Frigoriflavimonas asaccharolytica TaxID=2735899 RepID=A0A8J8GA14_9FLAO|nr:hypothetical protein [Frigoriflavimonas asaccharolytica]
MNLKNFGLSKNGSRGYTTAGMGLNATAGASYQYGRTFLFGTTQPRK